MKPFHQKPLIKSEKFLSKMIDLTDFHIKNCDFYKSYLNSFDYDINKVLSLSDIPYLPARFFKEFSLSSVSNSVAVAKSSGTSGLASEINLSHKTMLAQSIALNSIVTSFLGSEKRPMLIVDEPNVVKDKKIFNARGAAIMGFQKYGEPIHFAFDDSNTISIKNIEKFYEQSSEFGKGLIFGFTSTIWQTLDKLKEINFCKHNSKISLVHGGGWKKLADLKISNTEFNNKVSKFFLTNNIYNYYGMVEQTGSIFFQCEYGKMHSSSFSEVLVRDINTLEILPNGEEGVLQVFSSLPESYPGHSILTEDLGVVSNDEECECGRFGTTVQVNGRLPEAEIRGCSDVYI